EMGAVVEPVDPAWGPAGPELARAMWHAAYFGYVPSRAEDEAAMDPGLVALLQSAGGLTLKDVQSTYARRIAYAREIGNWFTGGFDLLVTPSASVAAFPVGRQRPEHWPAHPWDWLAWAEFTYPFNLAHAPAASVPCGLTKGGLPVGIQVGGPRHADALVL